MLDLKESATAGEVTHLPRVAVLVPVLRRPHRIEPVWDSAESTIPAGSRVLFIASPSDSEEIYELEQQGADYIVMDRDYPKGDYARKINTGYRATTEPLLFLASDDLQFHEGWFDAAVEKLGPTVGVVGTNDLLNPRVLKGIHSTHSLVTREYADFGTIDQPRAIYHEGYPHTRVDDEMVQTAMARGAFVMAQDAIVEHLHPYAAKADWDDVYELARPGDLEGRRLFESRKHLWQRRLPAWGAE